VPVVPLAISGLWGSIFSRPDTSGTPQPRPHARFEAPRLPGVRLTGTSELAPAKDST
jgi:hypothetical protein